ncbi:hypothetical protein CVT24_004797 [Panaeolus cyanescens]|uniref:BTB domain-containing protein n=1 Tax=Panaeolus cyanescens TaxID=181874 RepID=A0A409VQ61_9AGAR|nr:hypothetical protein CVT24_004797 [Panaeolus cyanescens]
MKLLFTIYLLVAFNALSVLAQRAFIGLPTEGATLTRGQTFTVQLVRPNSLQGSTEVGLIIGLAPCDLFGPTPTCASPQSRIGSILFNGDYKPQFHEQPGRPYQNFTVKVPAEFPTGQAQLSTARFHLVGISNLNDSEKRRPRPNPLDLININLPHVPETGLTHDDEYYKDESDTGFCIFRVENTLFKVHKCYLLREPSIFSDLLSLPCIQGSKEGLCDEWPITLSDTAEQFRDLLWVLYATPAQLLLTEQYGAPSTERILNIAQLANKYCIASYEIWAIKRLSVLAQSPTGFLRHASPELCARALEVASLVDEDLQNLLIHRLIPRMLWSTIDCKPILAVAKRLNIPVLQGIAYYKELLKYERHEKWNVWRGAGPSEPQFPEDMDEKTCEGFMAAHNSLVRLWEGLRVSPPRFSADGCSDHSMCMQSWREMWTSATGSIPTQRHASADVLGRLRATMIVLKKRMYEPHVMPLECTMAAMESIASVRESIVEGLRDHFHGELNV